MIKIDVYIIHTLFKAKIMKINRTVITDTIINLLYRPRKQLIMVIIIIFCYSHSYRFLESFGFFLHTRNSIKVRFRVGRL